MHLCWLRSRKALIGVVAVLGVVVITLVVLFAVIFPQKEYPPVDLRPLLLSQNAEGNSYDAYRLAYEDHVLSADLRVPLDSSPGTLEEAISRDFTVEVQEEGLYRLGVTLAPQGEADIHTADNEISVTVDGVMPFEESSSLYLPRQWIVSGDGPATDAAGNQLLPTLVESTQHYDSYAASRAVYTERAVCYYLTAGTHSVTITALNRPLAYESLFFAGDDAVYEAQGTADPTAKTITIQAENPDSRSSSSILELSDRTSARTIPVCVDKQVFNTLGGTSWQRVGDSVTWRFQVEKAGQYRLVFRCRQDYAGGIATYRLVSVDGCALPDGGLLRVPYALGWNRVTLSSSGSTDTIIYLEPGEHTLTLTCALGDMENVLNIMNGCLEKLNTYYRRIIMITSTDPDPYRDYRINEKIPEVLEGMKKQASVLRTVSSYLAYLNQGGGSETALLDKLARQLELLSGSHRKIATQVSTLNANISALGTWILDRTEQPLELDWIELVPEGGQETSVQASLPQAFLHGAKRLISSYTDDYNQLGAEGEGNGSVDVWLASGRDQAQIIQRLCDYQFTPESGVRVNLKLVQAGSLMSATMAGIGPDVSLMNGQSDPINYAVRHAVEDISGLPGFDEIAAQFYPSALVPYTYQGGVYALPETQSFPMLFYRRDIMEELHLSVPETWDDVLNIMTDLQKNNMQFGMPPSFSAYCMFLYQNGGKLYENGGESSRLSSPESVEAYRLWTKMYQDYQLPLTYDFLNRFRTGEVPLAIQDYGMYASLVIFAPEIRDKWDMTQVPGIADSQGNINRAVSSSGTNAMIFSGCKDLGNSWTFLRWWAGEQTQSRYAAEMETRLGPEARVSVANRLAFESLQWSREQSQQIQEQWQHVLGTPEVPGGYFLSRHVDNAFRKIVYQNEDRRETLMEYARIIDKELSVKRAEFGVE